MTTTTKRGAIRTSDKTGFADALRGLQHIQANIWAHYSGAEPNRHEFLWNPEHIGLRTQAVLSLIDKEIEHCNNDRYRTHYITALKQIKCAIDFKNKLPEAKTLGSRVRYNTNNDSRIVAYYNADRWSLPDSIKTSVKVVTFDTKIILERWNDSVPTLIINEDKADKIRLAQQQLRSSQKALDAYEIRLASACGTVATLESKYARDVNEYNALIAWIDTRPVKSFIVFPPPNPQEGLERERRAKAGYQASVDTLTKQVLVHTKALEALE